MIYIEKNMSYLDRWLDRMLLVGSNSSLRVERDRLLVKGKHYSNTENLKGKTFAKIKHKGENILLSNSDQIQININGVTNALL